MSAEADSRGCCTAEAFHDEVPVQVRAQWELGAPRKAPQPHFAQSDRAQTRFMPQPDKPSPKSQSFSRSYRSNLPTSLTYIVLYRQRLFTLETCCGYGYGLV